MLQCFINKDAMAAVFPQNGTGTRCYLVKAFVAVWTLVALLRVVRLQVSHLGGGVGEGLLAVVAVIRLLTAVHQLVALQIARRGEQLAADFAAVPCLTCVALAVQVEQADLSVALSTRRAAVWLQGAKRQWDAQIKT